jgi:hypothetical protein
MQENRIITINTTTAYCAQKKNIVKFIKLSDIILNAHASNLILSQKSLMMVLYDLLGD